MSPTCLICLTGDAVETATHRETRRTPPAVLGTLRAQVPPMIRRITPFVLVLFTACIDAPLDGSSITSQREPVQFAGYHTAANTAIDVEAYDRAAGQWVKIATAVTSSNPIQDQAGHTWYRFSTNIHLPSGPEFWRDVPFEAPQKETSAFFGPGNHVGFKSRLAIELRGRIDNLTLAVFESDADGGNDALMQCAADQGYDGIDIYSYCNSGFVADVFSACGGTGELCCRSGSVTCDSEYEACGNGYCVIQHMPKLAVSSVEPEDAGRDWAGEWGTSNGLQGIARTADYWYMATTNWLHKLDIDDIYGNDTVLTRTTFPSQIPLPVNHWGDIDFYDNKLWVAFETSGPDSGVAVFDENLNYISYSIISGGANAWVAINPVDGMLYAARSFDDVEGVDAYEISWLNGNLKLTRHHTIDFKGTGPIDAIQGGAFSANGNLYLSSDSEGHGLYVFDAAGNLRQDLYVPAYRDFPQFHELEGLTIWDTDVPGDLGLGQVHMLRRDSPEEDLHLVHFRVQDATLLDNL